jgi:hypothetical protein
MLAYAGIAIVFLLLALLGIVMLVRHGAPAVKAEKAGVQTTP